MDKSSLFPNIALTLERKYTLPTPTVPPIDTEVPILTSPSTSKLFLNVDRPENTE